MQVVQVVHVVHVGLAEPRKAGLRRFTPQPAKPAELAGQKKAAPLYAGSFFGFRVSLLLVRSHKLIQTEFASRNRPYITYTG